MPGARGRSPRAAAPPVPQPRPAPPTPFQVSWRVSRGGGSGARPPPRTPPLGGSREGRGAEQAPRFICLGILFLNAALHALTQKRGLSRRSARVLAWRVEILGFFLLRGPAGPPRPAAPKARWPCIGYFGCCSKVVQVKGKRGRGQRPGGGGRGGAGWGGVEAPRTHPPARRPGR